MHHHPIPRAPDPVYALLVYAHASAALFFEKNEYRNWSRGLIIQPPPELAHHLAAEDPLYDQHTVQPCRPL